MIFARWKTDHNIIPVCAALTWGRKKIIHRPTRGHVGNGPLSVASVRCQPVLIEAVVFGHRAFAAAGEETEDPTCVIL